MGKKFFKFGFILMICCVCLVFFTISGFASSEPGIIAIAMEEESPQGKGFIESEEYDPNELEDWYIEPEGLLNLEEQEQEDTNNPGDEFKLYPYESEDNPEHVMDPKSRR